MIACKSDACQQGRKPCPTPIECSVAREWEKKYSTPPRIRNGGERVDLPIGMEDGGFFRTIDDLLIAARWLLVISAAVAVVAAGAGYFLGK